MVKAIDARMVHGYNIHKLEITLNSYERDPEEPEVFKYFHRLFVVLELQDENGDKLKNVDETKEISTVNVLTKEQFVSALSTNLPTFLEEWRLKYVDDE